MATKALDHYKASGFAEIDGLFCDFYDRRLPDLTILPFGEGDGPGHRAVGTCPRCDCRTLYVDTTPGVWHCDMCDQGGGVVAFEVFSHPETYPPSDPAGAWHHAAFAVFREMTRVIKWGMA